LREYLIACDDISIFLFLFYIFILLFVYSTISVINSEILRRHILIYGYPDDTEVRKWTIDDYCYWINNLFYDKEYEYQIMIEKKNNPQLSKN
jgi:hypothetical protein